MDYIDYELNKYYQKQKIEDDMDRLGFDNYEEYIDYLADIEADKQEAYLEAIAEY